MDPSRYARAFGVQSESNKVTVTRVASNEIVYRRAVDTYRRDMASTMTNIHREQKKLRRNMRAYRRKLRETQNLPVKKRKPFKIGLIAYNSQTSFYDLPTTKDENKANNSEGPHEPDVDLNQFPPSKLQNQVDVFLKSVDEHVHNMHVKKQEVSDDEENNEIFYDKNGRRRFLFGSGGIGVSSDALKGLELELEGYHIESNDQFSDSSSEGGGDHDGVRKNVRNVSRQKRAAELLRLNSAYFTPINPADLDMDPPTNDLVSEIPMTENETAVIQPSLEGIQNASDAKDEFSKVLPPIPSVAPIQTSNNLEERRVGPQTFQNAVSVVVQKMRNKNNQEIAQEQTPTQTKSSEISNKKSSKVNFGDLIKFRHGVNTKKLFSMVDQLASRYGVSSKEQENEQGNKKTQGSTHQRTHQNLEPIHESSTKSSIFYAMKYGYGKNAGHPTKDKNKYNDAIVKGEHHHLPNSADKIQLDQSLNPEHIASPYHNIDIVDGSVMSSEHTDRRNELPFLQVSSPASLNRNSVDIKDSSRSGNATTPVHSQSFRSNDDYFKKKRPSILDASNYVSNLRRKTIIQEHDKMFGTKYDAHRFGPRRMPAALRKEPGMSEHQRKADDNKITWSSALGQMKLVHTLQDLTHFI